MVSKQNPILFSSTPATVRSFNDSTMAKELHVYKKAELDDLLQQSEDAMETLDKSLRRYYDTAMEIVPEIVANETPMINFLRTEDYHPFNAAKRLALYWKYRNDAFQERWLLPMVQTGRGAMTLQDIALLNTGFIYCQPAVGNQQAFVCVNFPLAFHVFAEAKAKGWDISNMVERASMYCTTVCTDADMQTRGAVLVCPVTSAESQALEFRPRNWTHINTGAPLKFTRLLVPQAFEPNKQELLDFKRAQTSIVMGFNSGLPPHEIQAHSAAQTVSLLEKSGIGREFTPVYLGGNFHMDAKFAAWTRMRVSLESMIDTPRALVTLPKPPKKTTSVLTKRKRQEPESEKDFIRKRNAVYSRRMYHKRKMAILSLEQEIKLWEDRNTAAREESKRLENLLSQAHFYLESSQLQSCIPMDAFEAFDQAQGIPQAIETPSAYWELRPSSFHQVPLSESAHVFGLPFQESD